MELQGKIIAIGQTEKFGAKEFKKRQLVIKTDSQYPQSIPVDFTQDKCSILDSYSLGEFVNVSVNVQGTEWKGKYYVNLQAWKIEKGEQEKTSASFMPDRHSAVSINHNTGEVEDDDLPF